MPTVTILHKGYFSNDKNGRTSSTITLVQDNALKIIVDPGTLPSPSVLVRQLKKHHLTTRDINLVYITHAHMDHYRNLGLFPKAKILDYWGVWDKDVCSKRPSHLTKNISIIHTPGHSDDSITLTIRTKQGTIAIGGDVFWKQNYPRKDPYASNQKKLLSSRNKLLKIADWIIPGHGTMFPTR